MQQHNLYWRNNVYFTKNLVHNKINFAGVELEFCSKKNYTDITLHKEINSCDNDNNYDDDNCAISHIDSILSNTTVTYDSSIMSCYDHFIYGVEFVSPPMHIDSMKHYLYTLETKISHFTKINDTCGTHFHFNAHKLELDDLVKIILGFAIFEPLLYAMAQNDRTKIKYSKPIGSGFLLEDIFYIKDNADLAFIILGMMPTQLKKVSSIRKYGNTTFSDFNPRYCGLNMYSYFFRKTFEIRYFENVNSEYNGYYFDICKFIINFSLNKSRKSLFDIIVNLSTSKTKYIKQIYSYFDNNMTNIVNKCLSRNDKKIMDNNLLSALRYTARLRNTCKLRFSKIEPIINQIDSKYNDFGMFITMYKLAKEGMILPSKFFTVVTSIRKSVDYLIFHEKYIHPNPNAKLYFWSIPPKIMEILSSKEQALFAKYYKSKTISQGV